MMIDAGAFRTPSLWRRSPRARRARRDVALSIALVLGALALILGFGVSDVLREALRADPLAAVGILVSVAGLPLCAAIWCLSRRRADAERLIGILRRRVASGLAERDFVGPSNRNVGHRGGVVGLAALLEASTAICTALEGGVGGGSARTLREAYAALNKLAEGDRDGESEQQVDLAQLLDGLSLSIRPVIQPDAPEMITINPRLLMALIENIAAPGRFSTEPPLLEVAMRDGSLTLTIARHLSRDAPPEPLRLRQLAARRLGGALTPLLNDEDVVVDVLALPHAAVAAPRRGYSAAAS